MEDFLYFFSFSDANIKYVVIGSVLLSISSALIGSFIFVKKQSLIGDALSHSVLPGICLSFLISGNKNPLFLVIGAMVTGWCSLWLIHIISHNTKIKEDAAIGITLSFFFSLGIWMLTIIQHSGNAEQSGLDHYIFGKAASIVREDVMVFLFLCLFVLSVIVLFYKEFHLMVFDKEFAKSIGLPTKLLEFLISFLSILSVVMGIQAVGIVLMSAMLITPVAISRFWTNNFIRLLLYSCVFSTFASVIGAYISYTAPSMPTGPWIVIVLSGIAFFSFFFSPYRGFFYKFFKKILLSQKILEENILKTFYALGEHNLLFFEPITKHSIQKKRYFSSLELKRGLYFLWTKGYIFKQKDSWKFTDKGRKKGQNIVKVHRLWEMYLANYLHIPTKNVHEDAENIEHIITPEIEKKLEQKLQFPHTDPHNSKIPY
ncbi:MAG: iron chelate uptake ABC transporter family permease subunit [Chitinophagaceae bacterium]|nr:iron chelate uptake ABC transporter family permease subunit [Chitinophagaceae bacterium]